MKQLFLILFPLFILLFPNQEKQNLLLTFKNASTGDFIELLVNIRGKEYIFHDVGRGQTTKPIRVKESYKYCYAKAITAKDTVVCQPIDFVGETLITDGKLLIIFEIAGEKGDRWLKSRSKPE